MKRLAEEEEEWEFQNEHITLVGKEPQRYLWDGIRLIPDDTKEKEEEKKKEKEKEEEKKEKEKEEKEEDEEEHSGVIWGSWDGGVVRIKKGESNLLHFIYLPGTWERLWGISCPLNFF